jgi:glycerophosphoryl diester phosphodiesterase
MALIYGHRGARGERPENTIEGFLHAKAAGVAGIETDIAMTADFVPVLHHDPGLADGRLICEMGFLSLKGIPSLEAALLAVREIDWLLEIKTFPPNPETSQPPAVMVEKTLAAMAAARIPAGRICILAFDWAVLRELAIQAPDVRRVCLTEPETQAARELWWGLGLTGSTPQAVAATGAYAWSAFHETLTAAQIAEAHALGLKVFAWTVNDENDFNRLAPLVDGIITDHPSRFIPPRYCHTPRN